MNTGLRHWVAVALASAAAVFSSFPAAAADPAPIRYYSGGPYRVGERVDVDGLGEGYVVGDFRQIPYGTASSDNPGHYFYAVLVPTPATPADGGCTPFSLSVVMVERQGSRNVVTRGARDADEVIREYHQRLDTLRSRVLSSTQRGREITAKADAAMKKWNARNDRSVRRFTTVEGYESLIFDMALAGVAQHSIGKLKGPDQVQNIVNETLINAMRSSAQASLPLATPGPGPTTSAAIELTRGTANVREALRNQLRNRLAHVDGPSRQAIAVQLLTQFGGLAAENPDDELAELAFDAIGDVMVDVGLAEYPIAGPLAKEALELTRQMRGYLDVLERERAADAAFTQALNAFNEAYGQRQALVEIERRRSRMYREMSDRIFRDDPRLEPALIASLMTRLTPRDGQRGGDLLVLGDDDLSAQLAIPGLLRRTNDLPTEEDEQRMQRLRTLRRPDPLDLFRLDPRTGLPGLPGSRSALDDRYRDPRACRVRYAAEAERLVPRIGPQVIDSLRLQRLLDPNEPSPSGLQVPRFDATRPRPLYVLPGTPAGRAGIRR